MAPGKVQPQTACSNVREHVPPVWAKGEMTTGRTSGKNLRSSAKFAGQACLLSGRGAAFRNQIVSDLQKIAKERIFVSHLKTLLPEVCHSLLRYGQLWQLG